MCHCGDCPQPSPPWGWWEEPVVPCKMEQKQIITPVALTWIMDVHPDVHRGHPTDSTDPSVHQGNPKDSELPFLLKLNLIFWRNNTSLTDDF